MRAHLPPLARWLRLALACLAVGSVVSPAQVASAVEPVAVAQGSPGKNPVAVAVAARASARVGAPAARRGTPLLFTRAWKTCAQLVFIPRGLGRPLFLLHRALLR